MRKSLYDQAQARIKRIEDSLTHQPIVRLPGQKFYYVFGWTKTNKKVCLGPMMTSQEADGKLAELEDGEVFELSTRDLQKAVREIRATLMSRGEDADEAIRRMLHAKGYEREERKR